LKRILVADDDPDILDALLQALEDTYHVLVAHNGREALDILAAQQVDALVLDLMMPIVDGQAVLDEMRRTGCKVPVVILSAGADVARVARSQGVRDWLTKPFDLTALERTLARLVSSGGAAPPAPTGRGGGGKPTPTGGGRKGGSGGPPPRP
jgi:DNA-binding response OmpR family regulator